MTTAEHRRDAGHWFATRARAEITDQARKVADRRGAPEIVHAHSADESCCDGCVTLLPNTAAGRSPPSE